MKVPILLCLKYLGSTSRLSLDESNISTARPSAAQRTASFVSAEVTKLKSLVKKGARRPSEATSARASSVASLLYDSARLSVLAWARAAATAERRGSTPLAASSPSSGRYHAPLPLVAAAAGGGGGGGWAACGIWAMDVAGGGGGGGGALGGCGRRGTLCGRLAAALDAGWGCSLID